MTVLDCDAGKIEIWGYITVAADTDLHARLKLAAFNLEAVPARSAALGFDGRVVITGVETSFPRDRVISTFSYRAIDKND